MLELKAESIHVKLVHNLTDWRMKNHCPGDHDRPFFTAELCDVVFWKPLFTFNNLTKCKDTDRSIDT